MTTLDQSISLLKSSSYWKERREAALVLGRSKESRANEALVEALNDPDDDVLQAVILSLGATGDNNVVEKMLLPRYLNHPDSRIRWATLKTIGKIGRSFVVTNVAELMNDEEWVVRNEVEKLLHKQVKSVLAECSDESAQRMMGLLITDNEDLRDILIEAFLQIGPRIMPLLRDSVRVGGQKIQTAMAYVLGKLKDADSVPILIELLDSSDKTIRKSAVDALGQIADESSIPAMIEKFADSSKEVQQSAVEALALIGKPAVEPLHEKLRYSSRKIIQKNVLLTLGMIKDPSSIPYFIEYMASTYFIVRRVAVNGLVHYGEKGAQAVLDVIRNVKLPMVDDLLKKSEHGATIGIRVRAIRALGALADHRAVHLLKRLAASEEPLIQKASLESLAQIGCSCWQRSGALAVLRELRLAPDVDLIVEQLDDDSENVRFRTVQVLARCENPRAVPALLQTVAIDGNPIMRYEALRAADILEPGNPRIVETANRALEDPAPQVQAEAARVIGRSPSADHLPLLLECLKNPSWEVRRNTALALGNIGVAALPYLLERLEKGNETEVESVIRAIGNIGDPEAMSKVDAILDNYPKNSPVQYAAVKAFAEIRKREEEKEKHEGFSTLPS